MTPTRLKGQVLQYLLPLQPRSYQSPLRLTVDAAAKDDVKHVNNRRATNEDAENPSGKRQRRSQRPPPLSEEGDQGEASVVTSKKTGPPATSARKNDWDVLQKSAASTLTDQEVTEKELPWGKMQKPCYLRFPAWVNALKR